MDPNAPRNRGRNPAADVYWRRRFFALATGLAVLGIIAWASSGGGSGPATRQAAASGRAAAGKTPAASAGTAVPGQHAGPVPTQSARPTVSPSAPASPRDTSPAAGASPAASAAPAGAQGGTCPAQDVVLTLLVSKASYTSAETPEFQVDVVSTGPAACSFNVGPAALRLLITGGSRATWDSGACLPGTRAHLVELRRGVPMPVWIAWHRQLRAGGCGTAPVPAGPGHYQAMAADGGATSSYRAFELQVPGPAQPASHPSPR